MEGYLFLGDLLGQSIAEVVCVALSQRLFRFNVDQKVHQQGRCQAQPIWRLIHAGLSGTSKVCLPLLDCDDASPRNHLHQPR